MKILIFIIFIINFFISFNLLIQEDSTKASNLSFVKSSFFESFTEKISFFLIIIDFFLLLIEKKFDLT